MQTRNKMKIYNAYFCKGSFIWRPECKCIECAKRHQSLPRDVIRSNDVEKENPKLTKVYRDYQMSMSDACNYTTTQSLIDESYYRLISEILTSYKGYLRYLKKEKAKYAEEKIKYVNKVSMDCEHMIDICDSLVAQLSGVKSDRDEILVAIAKDNKTKVNALPSLLSDNERVYNTTPFGYKKKIKNNEMPEWIPMIVNQIRHKEEL